tara:strand:+ start:150 stop:1520 length:1371 start_codon:yes stop_codon:yes gene_type:complete
MKTVSIIGQGFTGAIMSIVCARAIKKKKNLYKVYGLEKDNFEGKKIIKNLNKGIFPFNNNDLFLKSELKKVIKQKNFIATTDKKCIKKSEIILININFDIVSSKTKKKDLINFKNILNYISNNIKKNSLIIIETTVPPGYCQNVIQPIINKAIAKRKFGPNSILLSHSYERVTPGKNYLNSVINAPRVFAADSKLAQKKTRDFFDDIINVKKYPLTKLENTVASETSKIIENSYRAVNIAFIHEWTEFAEKAKINLFEIIEAIKKRKTHSNIRYPGLGVGGYCLTKDPLYGAYSARNVFKYNGINFPFSTLAIKRNSKMPDHTIEVIKKNLRVIKNKTIVLAGIAYKSDVADTRQSPSKTIYEFLKKKKAKILCVDPLVRYWDEKKVNVQNITKKFKKIDAIIFAVPHQQFKNISSKSFVNNKAFILDCNNCLSNKQRNEFKNKSFKVKIIGDGTF